LLPEEVTDYETLAELIEVKEMSPLFFVNERFPPTILITGEADKLKISSEVFYEELKKCGVTCDFHLGTGKYSVHCYALLYASKIGKIALKKAFEFVDRVMKKEQNV
jgi:acetyl esterase/lipase